MKLLSGQELAGYIKERQARQVRALRQAEHIEPKLAIIQTIDDPVIATYVRVKQRYGEDILVDAERHMVASGELFATIKRLNADESVRGIIIQLPLADKSQTQEAVDMVAPEKDVDGLGQTPQFDPATPLAINWLLAGYNVDLADKKIAIVGRGRLVGRPLETMWRASGYDVTVCDRTTPDLAAVLRQSQVVVTATGQAGLITSDMIAPGSVVVDAGTASEQGKIVGDLAGNVRQRDDLTITPEKGGVGPLTVAALFENVIQAARRRTQISH